MSAPAQTPVRAVLSLAELLTDHPKPEPCLIEPGLLPSQGILFLGGEPKAGKSLLVANLALALEVGGDHAGFKVPSAKRVLICQFELPTPQFALRLATMRQAVGDRADSNLFVDTRASGHMLSSTAGLNHFLNSARSVQADVIIIDPLYSTHDQDENDTRAMAALCQALIRLRDASKAALIVVHHIRKAAGRWAALPPPLRRCPPSAIPLCCWRPLRRRPPRSTSASSSATPRLLLPASCRWLLPRCGFPLPVRRLPRRRLPAARWSRPMS